MSADFDAAVAAMLGDVHSTFGRAATYAPPAGSPVACLVVVNRADDATRLGDSPILSAQNVIEVRRSEIASPVKGGVFAIGAESFRVVAAPRIEDPDRLVWTCLCNPV